MKFFKLNFQKLDTIINCLKLKFIKGTFIFLMITFKTLWISHFTCRVSRPSPNSGVRFFQLCSKEHTKPSQCNFLQITDWFKSLAILNKMAYQEYSEKFRFFLILTPGYIALARLDAIGRFKFEVKFSVYYL